MDGVRRGRWIYGILLTVPVVGVLVLLAISRDRGDASGVIQAVVAVGTAYFAVLALVWRRAADRRRGDQDGELCQVLAELVETRARQVAAERRLLTPNPIPMFWTLAQAGVSGPVIDVVGGRLDRRRREPLPGFDRVGVTALARGQVRDLYSVHAGLDSGRMAIVGGPGAGKSAAGTLLVLDALAHRAGASDDDKAVIPVPLPLTFGDWDPSRASLADWVTQRFSAEYPEARRSLRAGDLRRLLDRGLLTLVLDGLDELPETFRAGALGRIDEEIGSGRLVLLSRLDELASASAVRFLPSTAILRLRETAPKDAAAYLARCRPEASSPVWSAFVEKIRGARHQELTAVVGTPFFLTLIDDALPGDAEIREFAEAAGREDAAALRARLLDGLVRTAYRERADQAERELRTVVAAMDANHAERIAWWVVAGWRPAGWRVGITACLIGLCIALGLLAAELAMIWSAFPISDDDFLIEVTVDPWSEVRYGIVVAFIASIVVGLPAAVAYTRTPRRLRRLRLLTLRELLSWRTVLLLLNAAGIGVVTAVTGIFLLQEAFAAFSEGDEVVLVEDTTTYDYSVGVVYGALASAVLFLVVVIPIIAVRGESGDAVSAEPVVTWRRDRRYSWFIGGAVGLWATYQIWQLLSFRLMFMSSGIGSMVIGLVVCFSFLVATVAVFGSPTWGARLATIQLHRKFGTPLRLLRFLEDAHERGILRTVGPAYEFRHTLLRENLANRTDLVPREG